MTPASSPWLFAPHLRVLDRALCDIATGKLRRLIVEMPPRHGKSELTSKFFPVWYLGMRPTRNVIMTSATDELASDFSAASRDLMQSHGQSLFGVQLSRSVAAKKHWALLQGGSVRAAGVGGSIMGRGAHLLILDDYFKSHEDALSEANRERVYSWFMSTSSTRLEPDGAIVVVATRWHRDDLIGRLLRDQERGGGDQWHVIRFAAIAEQGDPLGRQPGEALFPQRYDRQWMEARRASYTVAGYRWMWDALYQQTPPDMIGNEWSSDYFGDRVYFDHWPDASQIAARVAYCDPSLGKTDRSDYSAIILAAITHDGGVWLDASVERRDTTKIARDVVALNSLFRPATFGIEANGFQELLGDLIAHELQRQSLPLTTVPIDPVINHAAKVTRIRGLTPFLARGDLHFKRSSPGVALLIEQLRAFPSGKHDDGPDALAGAIDRAFWLLHGQSLPAATDEPPAYRLAA